MRRWWPSRCGRGRTACAGCGCSSRCVNPDEVFLVYTRGLAVKEAEVIALLLATSYEPGFGLCGLEATKKGHKSLRPFIYDTFIFLTRLQSVAKNWMKGKSPQFLTFHLRALWWPPLRCVRHHGGWRGHPREGQVGQRVGHQ